MEESTTSRQCLQFSGAGAGGFGCGICTEQLSCLQQQIDFWHYGFTIQGTKLGGAGYTGQMVGVAMTQFDGISALSEIDTITVAGEVVADSHTHCYRHLHRQLRLHGHLNHHLHRSAAADHGELCRRRWGSRNGRRGHQRGRTRESSPPAASGKGGFPDRGLRLADGPGERQDRGSRSDHPYVQLPSG